MDFTNVSHFPSSSFLDHLKAIVNASPGIGRASPSVGRVGTFFRVENIIMWEVPGFENSSHQRVGVGEDSPTLFG